MLRAARGRPPENPVNSEVVERAEFRRKLSRFAENDVGPNDGADA
jgi:hypothetical protein